MPRVAPSPAHLEGPPPGVDLSQAIGPGELEPEAPPAPATASRPAPQVIPVDLNVPGVEEDPFALQRARLETATVGEIPGIPFPEFAVRAFEALVRGIGLAAFSEDNKTHFLAKIPVAYRRLALVVRRGPKGDAIPWPDKEAWATGTFGADR